MNNKKVDNSNTEVHIIVLTRVIDIVRADEKRISISLVNYMRSFIEQEVSEDKKILFSVYVTNCALPYLKTLIKTINELDQPVKIKLRVTSLDNCMNIIEEQITGMEGGSEYYLKTRTVLDLNPSTDTTIELVRICTEVAKRFEVLNDFEKISLV